MSRISVKNREILLHEYYRRFHQPRFLEWDPLLLVREFSQTESEEYIALVSALMAFGGVKQILSSLRRFVVMIASNGTKVVTFRWNRAASLPFSSV
jgi:hypothetical protein